MAVYYLPPFFFVSIIEFGKKKILEHLDLNVVKKRCKDTYLGTWKQPSNTIIGSIKP
jgi:hypothetical protein